MKQLYEIVICPYCGGMLIGEEHDDPDGTPNGWYCQECDAHEFEPRVLNLIPVEKVREGLSNLIERQVMQTREAGEVVATSSIEAFADFLEDS